MRNILQKILNYFKIEIIYIYTTDILRMRTKLFIFIFNLIPNLYFLKILKNISLLLAGMKVNILSTYVVKPFYCDNAKNIKIGKGSFINSNAYFEGNGKVIIGKACQIGPNVSFFTTNHLDRSKDVNENIIIGDNVWIGGGSIILHGAEIGDNINIAAGAIVKGKINNGKLWAGNIAVKRR